MLRRLAAAVVLLAVGALAVPAVVEAETVTSTLVRGRIFWGVKSSTAFTLFGQLTVYGAAPGGRLASRAGLAAGAPPARCGQWSGRCPPPAWCPRSGS